jgi:hypothetical protein
MGNLIQKKKKKTKEETERVETGQKTVSEALEITRAVNRFYESGNS